MLEGKPHSCCALYSALHGRTPLSAELPAAAALKSLLFPPAVYSPKEKLIEAVERVEPLEEILPVV